jgi:hypothetical protein
MVWKLNNRRHGKRFGARHAAIVLAAALALLLGMRYPPPRNADGLVLRIYDWKSGAVQVEIPAKVNSQLFFGWIHSLEKIPWNEYFHIDAERNLVLDAITFPAFGAGIPENKGRKCYVQDGLIHMEEIGQVFTELNWLNSHTATQEILLDGVHVARGSELPQHARLRLIIEKR